VVNALYYETEGRGFEIRWGEWISSIYLIFKAALGPGVHSASNRMSARSRKILLRGRCMALTTSAASASRLCRQCGILNISQPYRFSRFVMDIGFLESQSLTTLLAQRLVARIAVPFADVTIPQCSVWQHGNTLLKFCKCKLILKVCFSSCSEVKPTRLKYCQFQLINYYLRELSGILYHCVIETCTTWFIPELSYCQNLCHIWNFCVSIRQQNKSIPSLNFSIECDIKQFQNKVYVCDKVYVWVVNLCNPFHLVSRSEKVPLLTNMSSWRNSQLIRQWKMFTAFLHLFKLPNFWVLIINWLKLIYRQSTNDLHNFENLFRNNHARFNFKQCSV
jgi:hypothetical protein